MDFEELAVVLAQALGVLLLTLLVVRPERFMRLRADRHVLTLLELCRGNRGEVFRLVELEKKRAPEISEKVAYERAIKRLSRDKSR